MATDKKEYMRKYWLEHKERRKEYDGKYYLEHREGRKEHSRKYAIEHKDERREWRMKYNKEHSEDNRAYNQKYHLEHSEERKEYHRIYHLEHEETEKERCRKYSLDHREDRISRRKNVIGHYGGKCTFCGDSNLNHLCMDHINNDGYIHRKTMKVRDIYWWLLKNNYPEGFQVLCHNHNMEKALYHTMTLDILANIQN